MKLKQILVMAAVFTMSMSGAALAGTWQAGTEENQGKWWYDNGDGCYFYDGWRWIDGDGDGIGECYYFDKEGWLLTNTVTPDGCTVDGNGAWVENGNVRTEPVIETEWIMPSKNNGKWAKSIAPKSTSIYGVWKKGSEARAASQPWYSGDYRPYDWEGTHGDDWWYDCYYGGISNGGSGRKYASSWRWIDEDKEGNRDGILNLYYFDGPWLATNQTVDGRQLNEDGAWVVDGVVQTVSERRDVKGNSNWCGLTPGVYWDTSHEGRIEISEDKKVRYYDGSNQLLMEGNVLEPSMSRDYAYMFSYAVEPTFDAVFDSDPFENKSIRYLGIYVDGGVDYSGRGYSSYGDISVVNSYGYGIFNRAEDIDRDRLFFYEE